MTDGSQYDGEFINGEIQVINDCGRKHEHPVEEYTSRR